LNRLLGNDHLKKYSDFSGGKKNNMIQNSYEWHYTSFVDILDAK
jgi:hypothetical protein